MEKNKKKLLDFELQKVIENENDEIIDTCSPSKRSAITK